MASLPLSAFTLPSSILWLNRFMTPQKPTDQSWILQRRQKKGVQMQEFQSLWSISVLSIRYDWRVPLNSDVLKVCVQSQNPTNIRTSWIDSRLGMWRRKSFKSNMTGALYERGGSFEQMQFLGWVMKDFCWLHTHPYFDLPRNTPKQSSWRVVLYPSGREV